MSDQLLQRLYAEPEKAAHFLAPMDAQTRARIAIFCYRRHHLRGAGLALAADCDLHALVEAGGYMGTLLYREARTPAERLPLSETALRKRVTLASGPVDAGSVVPALN
jgi:hypothetical protein